MAKIKGRQKLNKVISTELKPFGISKAVCGKDYSYLCENESITYKITENTIEDLWFAEFIKDRFNYDVRYPFVISLLHEVGHHKTGESIDDVIYDFCMIEKERIENEMQNADAEYSKKLEWQYFNLPDEIIATQWAVNYAKKHPKKIKKMWEKMRKAFLDFYNKNEIFESLDNI